VDITYLGHSSFRLKGKTASIITDPFDPSMVGLKYPPQEANIVTVSHNHPDHNKVDLVKDVGRVVDGPGEYEISGVSIIGIPSFHDDKKGEERGKNTVFVFEIDDLRLAHLGDLGHKLSSDAIEEMGEIDILMVPVGGKYTIDSQTAVEVVRSIEPSIIIPMHYLMDGMNPEIFSELEKAEVFVNAMGVPSETMEKLSTKKSEIGEEQKIVLLEKK
jgi:L-ascorbate metabolism protein UlaG (beta-lactamase superfamily)